MRTLHLMLNVKNLEAAKIFYQNLLGQEATKVKNDYIQWKIDSPNVNLSIKSDPNIDYGVNHLGIETDSESDLLELYANAQRANAELEEEGHTTCCYSKSQKSWVKDENDIEWELFTSYEESATYYQSEQEPISS